MRWQPALAWLLLPWKRCSPETEPQAQCWLYRSPARRMLSLSLLTCKMELSGVIPSAPPYLRPVREELSKFPTAGQASETRVHHAAGPRLPALPPDVRAFPKAGLARPALLAAVTGGVDWDSQGTTTLKTYPQRPCPLISKTHSPSSLCGGLDGRAQKFMHWGRGRERYRYDRVRVLLLLMTLWQLGRAWPAAGPASPRRIGKVGWSLNGALLAASGPAAWEGGTAAAGPPCPHARRGISPLLLAACSSHPAASKRQLSFAGTYYMFSSVWGDQMDETKWLGQSPAQCWAWSVFGGTLCGVLKEDLARCRMQG